MPRSSTAQKECFPCLTTIQTNVKYHKKVLNLPPVFLIYFFYSGNKKKKKRPEMSEKSTSNGNFHIHVETDVHFPEVHSIQDKVRTFKLAAVILFKNF